MASGSNAAFGDATTAAFVLSSTALNESSGWPLRCVPTILLLCASVIRCTSHSCSLCDRSCKVSRFLGTKIGPTLSHLVSFLTNCTLASFNIPNFTQSTARQMQYSMLWHSATKIQRCWFTRPTTRFAISAVLMQFTRSHSLPASPRRG